MGLKSELLKILKKSSIKPNKDFYSYKKNKLESLENNWNFKNIWITMLHILTPTLQRLRKFNTQLLSHHQFILISINQIIIKRFQHHHRLEFRLHQHQRRQ